MVFETQRARLEESKIVDGVPENIEDLFLDKKTADVFFVFKCGTEIPAHSWILSGGSEVFKGIFDDEMQSTRIINIKNAILDWFEVFLESFYKRKMDLRFHSIDLVMLYARQYKAKHCFKTCVQYLMVILNIMDEFVAANAKLLSDKAKFSELFEQHWTKIGIEETFTDVLCIVHQIAGFFDCNELLAKCQQLLKTFGCYVIEAIPSSECVSKRQLEAILSTDFDHRNESDVFDACVVWAKKHFGFQLYDENQDGATLRELLGELSFSLIRFDAMTLTQFEKCFEEYGSAFSGEEVDHIFEMIETKQ